MKRVHVYVHTIFHVSMTVIFIKTFIKKYMNEMKEKRFFMKLTKLHNVSINIKTRSNTVKSRSSAMG